jgi:glutathione S-transferase
LRETGLAFELDRMDPATRRTTGGEDFFKVNPKGSVPALRLDNGEVLTEVAVVLQYIADLNPESGLAPAAGSMDRYRLAEWLNYISSDVHKQFSPFFNPRLPPAWRDNQIDLLGKRFDLLAGRLKNQPYLTGGHFTVADIYLFVVLRWSGLHKLDMSRWPALTDYLARVAARPAVQAALKAEGLA